MITCVIPLAQWPEVARLTRSLVLVEREKPCVDAAKTLDLHKISILIKHVIAIVFKQASPVIL